MKPFKNNLKSIQSLQVPSANMVEGKRLDHLLSFVF